MEAPASASEAMTPVPAGVLRNLVAQADCAAELQKLNERMDDLEGRFSSMDDKLDAMPVELAKLVLDQQRWRHKCVSKAAESMVNDPLVRRLVAVTLLLAVVLTIAGGLLSTLDLQLGDWLSVSSTTEP